MLSKEKIIVGLEVGTSKVCAVVGEVLDDGNIMVIGVGRANSEGVRKGEIVNIDAAVERIHAAVSDAEESAGVEIHNVFASVSGGHIRSFNNRGTVAVTSEDREISEEEVRSVLLNAKATGAAKKKAIVAVGRRLAIDLWRLNTDRSTAEKLGLK